MVPSQGADLSQSKHQVSDYRREKKRSYNRERKRKQRAAASAVGAASAPTSNVRVHLLLEAAALRIHND